MQNFKIVIKGVGGQGIITLVSIIDKAAFLEKYDVKSSELHGLSQREGSVETHVIMGKKVNSPLACKGEADLVIGLELQEGLRGACFAKKSGKFLFDKNIIPFLNGLSEQEIRKNLEKLDKNSVHLVAASEMCKKELGNDVVAGIYLLAYAVSKKLIPFKKQSVLSALEKVIPSKYLEINKKAFNLAKI